MDKYLIALSEINGLGQVTLKKLIDLFGSAQNIWQAKAADLKNFQLPEKIIKIIINERLKLNPDKIVEQIIKEQIKTTDFFEPAYPKLLKEIYAPPMVLFYRGDLKILNQQKTLAVVGSRKISPYVQTVLPNLLNLVIQSGVIIISGLAYGVDQLAHLLCVKQKRPTAAVAGFGLAWDYFYPKGNQKLAVQILETGGLLISEFSPYVRAHPANFPRRNRIIAGLAEAVLIAEASAKSGALITAAYGVEQNRDVLALPQNINAKNSIGVNRLIATGAKIVCSENDIFESLNIYIPEARKNNRIEPDLTALTGEEAIIYKILTASPVHIDKIIQHCTLDTSLVNACLIQLEIKNLIKNIGSQNYVKL